MPERLTGEHVVETAQGYLEEWFNGGYCFPMGPDGPQFKAVLHDDGTYVLTPAFMYNEDSLVHEDDRDGARFRLVLTAERILEP